jgi:hypothetical protein
MMEGSCFCGAVAYRAESVGPIGHCHCRTCQKVHSAAFATTARAPRAGFAWTRGADIVASIETTPGKLRYFCPRCGSHLVAEWKDQGSVILRVASLDTPLPSKPAIHIWTSNQAAFFDFDDGLPRLAEGVPRPPEN